MSTSEAQPTGNPGEMKLYSSMQKTITAAPAAIGSAESFCSCFDERLFVAALDTVPQGHQMDCDKGAVFYLFDNRPDTAQPLERETMQCLSCHDTFARGTIIPGVTGLK